MRVEPSSSVSVVKPLPSRATCFTHRRRSKGYALWARSLKTSLSSFMPLLSSLPDQIFDSWQFLSSYTRVGLIDARSLHQGRLEFRGMSSLRSHPLLTELLDSFHIITSSIQLGLIDIHWMREATEELIDEQDAFLSINGDPTADAAAAAREGVPAAAADEAALAAYEAAAEGLEEEDLEDEEAFLSLDCSTHSDG